MRGVGRRQPSKVLDEPSLVLLLEVVVQPMRTAEQGSGDCIVELIECNDQIM
jgi:hypothetical protein